ncbi:CBS domain-containing protein [Virgibacillus profundi]|uniref:CBS domain-containing protein n=1 Tax=Virgibacillus profundi TaxID=2024555 RepID=A0A2A2IBM1_9BACI|nr:CBS domain-containing protein [Virgibacillus profundi]PAV29401.1 CBS domain-containing protein [Virgibacillus profundi]PXY53571.1 CBS domain-containing protein [Virgibacillus profundi]
MKIIDFMIKDVISVTKDATIKELLEKLVTNGIGGVPVLDKDNQLLGVISDGDVIRYLQPKGRNVYDMFAMVLVSEKESLTYKLKYALDKQVNEIMRKKGIHTVHPDDNIEKALAIFSRYHFKKIPVINDSNQVVGVLSRGDLIRFITTELIAKTDD